MEKKAFEDRRVFERFAVQLSSRFINLNTNREGLAKSLDISAKGVGLVTDEEVKEKTPVEIWLDLPDRSAPFYARGQVVWSRVSGEKEYRLGIDLEKADLLGMSRVLRFA
jgi:hypothetical protein